MATYVGEDSLKRMQKWVFILKFIKYKYERSIQVSAYGLLPALIIIVGLLPTIESRIEDTL